MNAQQTVLSFPDEPVKLSRDAETMLLWFQNLQLDFTGPRGCIGIKKSMLHYTHDFGTIYYNLGWSDTRAWPPLMELKAAGLLEQDDGGWKLTAHAKAGL